MTSSTDADLMVTDLRNFGITGLPDAGPSWVVTCEKGGAVWCVATPRRREDDLEDLLASAAQQRSGESLTIPGPMHANACTALTHIAKLYLHLADLLNATNPDVLTLSSAPNALHLTTASGLGIS